MRRGTIRTLKQGTGLALASPGILLLALFAVLPMIALIIQSFADDGGGITAGSFAQVLGNGDYLALIARSLGVATVVTVISVALSWPVAWAIAWHVPAERRGLILALVIIPFLTSQLLLIYAMLVLLGARGPLMSVVAGTGLVAPDDSILYTPIATVIMFIYESLSVIVILLYTATERIDARLLAASRSLGAGAVRTFANVVWPATSTSLISAASITFVATAGAFAESAILGGPDGALIGNVIADRIRGGGDSGVTAALAVTLLVASLVCVALLAALIRRAARPMRSLAPAFEALS